MDKLKLGALGERLKTSSAQMSRMVSGKMKDLLQPQTPESKMVDDATSDHLQEPNWGMNLRICGLLNSGEFSGQEVVKAIKRKISSSKNGLSQLLSLDLLEACAMNCEKVFSEIASEKVLEEMIKMIDNPQMVHGNRLRALQLIRAWGESEDLAYLPVFRQTYEGLKARGALQDGNPAFSPLGFNMNQQQPVAPPAISDMDLHDDTIIFPTGRLSSEEKKEFVVTTRNSIELLSSMLNTEDPIPLEDEVTLSMVEKCKESQNVILRMIESTNNDEAMLFEALNLNDELQQVVAKYDEAVKARAKGKSPETSGNAEVEAKTDVERSDMDNRNFTTQESKKNTG